MDTHKLIGRIGSTGDTKKRTTAPVSDLLREEHQGGYAGAQQHGEQQQLQPRSRSHLSAGTGTARSSAPKEQQRLNATERRSGHTHKGHTRRRASWHINNDIQIKLRMTV